MRLGAAASWSWADCTTLRPVVGGWSEGAPAEDPLLAVVVAGALAGDFSAPNGARCAGVGERRCGLLVAPPLALPADEAAALLVDEGAVLLWDEYEAAEEDSDEAPLCPPATSAIPTITATPATIAPAASHIPAVGHRRRGLRGAGGATAANLRPTRSSMDSAKPARACGRSAVSSRAISASSAYSAPTGSPASTASIASREAATSGSIGSSWSSSRIAGLPELLHRSVQQRAGVRFADSEHLGQLGVGQSGVKLERDDLALAGGQPGQRGLDCGAPERHLGAVVVGHRVDVGGLAEERGHAPAAA